MKYKYNKLFKTYLKAYKKNFKISQSFKTISNNCKLILTVPVYNEPLTNILKLLDSLVNQQNISFDDFEVVFNINNSKTEAIKRTKSYKNNQKILKYLKKIHNSKLKFLVVDKSSKKFADDFNSISKARDYLGYLAVERFYKIRNFSGVVAITDADCTVSDNYVSQIIKLFAKNNLNGLSGQLQLVFNPVTKYVSELKKVSKYLFGPGLFELKPQIPANLFKLKPNSLVLDTGQNMVVSTAAFCAVGGVGREDQVFGRNIQNLPGLCLKTNAFVVFTQVRISTRAGLSSFGRKVNGIYSGISNYLNNITNQLWVPDLAKSQELINVLHSQYELGLLTPEKVLEILNFYDCTPNTWDLKKAVYFLNLLKKDYGYNIEQRNLALSEAYILKTLYKNFPKQDLTRLLNY